MARRSLKLRRQTLAAQAREDPMHFCIPLTGGTVDLMCFHNPKRESGIRSAAFFENNLSLTRFEVALFKNGEDQRDENKGIITTRRVSEGFLETLVKREIAIPR